MGIGYKFYLFEQQKITLANLANAIDISCEYRN
jgi:hypothetical protein